LLEVSLLQSVGLLLVPLLDLLHFDLVSILSVQTPVLMLLTPLELLALPFLFSKEFLPLPQVFSVQIGITGVGSGRAFEWRKLFGMDWLVRQALATTIRLRIGRCSGFSRRDDRTFAKLYWPGRGSG